MYEVNNSTYYCSKQYRNDILGKVGLNDSCIELNFRFMQDIYRACMEEYEKNKNKSALKPLAELQHIFSQMINRSLIKFHEYQMSLSECGKKEADTKS
jgi:hypothetical protein